MYQPGICNIGAREVRKRKIAAVAGLLVSLVAAVVIYLLALPVGYRLLLFFPLFGATLGLMQAMSKFCVMFGMQGVFKFDEASGEVDQAMVDYVRSDRAKSLQLIVKSIAIAAAATAGYFLL